MTDDCIFCKIGRKEAKADIVMESDSFIAFKDIDPRTDGHTLVVPKKHYVTLLDIPDQDGTELLTFAKQVASHLLEQGYGTGFNIIMNNQKIAGQIVMHAHIHILPRRKGDKVTDHSGALLEGSD